MCLLAEHGVGRPVWFVGKPGEPAGWNCTVPGNGGFCRGVSALLTGRPRPCRYLALSVFFSPSPHALPRTTRAGPSHGRGRPVRTALLLSNGASGDLDFGCAFALLRRWRRPPPRTGRVLERRSRRVAWCGGFAWRGGVVASRGRVQLVSKNLVRSFHICGLSVQWA